MESIKTSFTLSLEGVFCVETENISFPEQGRAQNFLFGGKSLGGADSEYAICSTGRA